MEIHFCDLCNESVPQSDLDQGRAFLRKGRAVCASCDLAMGGRETAGQTIAVVGGAASATLAPPPVGAGAGSATAELTQAAAAAQVPDAMPAPGTPVAGGVLIGLLALVFASGATAVLIDRIGELDDQVVQQGSDLSTQGDRQQRLGEDIEGRLSRSINAVEARLSATQESTGRRLVEALALLRADLELAREETAGFRAELIALRTVAEGDAKSTDSRLIALEEQHSRVEEEVRFYGNRIIEIEETMRGLAAGGFGPIAQGVPADDGMVSGGLPAWNGLLADLSSKNAGIRLDAIYALGETRDAGVAAHIIPMLEDVDIFVRMGAARILEKLDARSAVPALIEVLGDAKTAVREAAMLALRKITDKDFNFDPLASEGDRKKRVKAWRSWWEKSGEEFASGA